MNKDLQKSDSERVGIYEPGFFRVYIPQLVLALIITVASFYIGNYHGDFILLSSGAGNMHLSARLAYALCCSLPMLLSLYAGIEVITIQRSVTAAANPLAGNEHLIQLHKNYVTNTLEQLFVGLTLMLIVAAYTDSPQVLRLLPVYSVLFTIARIIFWIGYSITHLYRALGMAINFFCNYVMFGMVFYYTLTKGPAAVLGSAQLLSESTLAEGHQEL